MTNKFVESLLDELDAMVLYATGNGESVPSEVVVHVFHMQQKLAAMNSGSAANSEAGSDGFNEEELSRLSCHHAEMTVLIEPARPKSVALLKKDADNPTWLHFLGAVPLIRKLSVLAVIFLLLIIGTATSPTVNTDTLNSGLFKSSGLTLLLNQLFLLSCAGLGATFGCLHKLSEYIKVGTYDPKFDSSYWIRVVMGLIAGLIISELLPLNSISGEQVSGLEQFDKPVAALLGGFSADLIYRILNRFIELANQLFSGGRQSEGSEVAKMKQQIRKLNQVSEKTSSNVHRHNNRSYDFHNNEVDTSTFHPSGRGEIAGQNLSELVVSQPLAKPEQAVGIPVGAYMSDAVKSELEVTGASLVNREGGVRPEQEHATSLSSEASQSDNSILDQFSNNNGVELAKMSSQRLGSELSEPTSSTNTLNTPLVSGSALTYDAEGTEGGKFHSRKLHVPSNNSGLTLGRGFDMKARSSDKINSMLAMAGVSEQHSNVLSKASGLSGKEAQQFILDHNLTDFEISEQTQIKLFNATYEEMVADVQRICAKPDCVEAYGRVDWQHLDDKIKTVLIDLRYRGDYDSRSRKRVQQYIAENNLAQFRECIEDKVLWSGVPVDRFNRRVEFINS
ncbi:hypothetical protein PRUB_a0108 [Pseudoalteromonas rubra]|uniref:Pesticin C-terminal domain-containing protein n=1 Tax=Pseudoalteromonas rubra TaxID=43658 RepID=A0A8T0C6W0_9GAMM|nr:pesticin C-terminus-like muramidase [Pseudoalteromonas rubra]KAF7785735.1 hypothetical protein PRUB_a0108 [Pseudoalteromonas rubra]